MGRPPFSIVTARSDCAPNSSRVAVGGAGTRSRAPVRRSQPKPWPLPFLNSHAMVISKQSNRKVSDRDCGRVSAPLARQLGGTYFPDEEPLEFFLENRQAGLLAFKRYGQFAQHLPNRFGEPVIELQQAGDFLQELLAGQMFSLARAKEPHAQAGDQRSRADGDPVPNAFPTERLFECHAGNDSDRGHADQSEHRARISARCQRENGEQKEKPERRHRGREVDEDRQDAEIHGERNAKPRLPTESAPPAPQPARRANMRLETKQKSAESACRKFPATRPETAPQSQREPA